MTANTVPPKTSRRPALLGVALMLGLASCATPTEELPTYPVELRLGGALPESSRVGDYTVAFTEGYIVLGDWWLYGMDREAAGYAALLKHAGHAHGEAEFEANVEGTFVVDLLGEPAVLATQELTEGHYFDGSIRLRPATELYEPVYAWNQMPQSPQDDLWGHSFILTGTATLNESTYDFRITVDAEAMIAGLVYGATVRDNGAQVITTRLELGALLQDVDFAALADADGQVVVQACANTDTYNLIKARLQDPLLYTHYEAEAVPQ